MLSANVTLNTDLPTISSAIKIEGGAYAIDGADRNQLFNVSSSGNLTVSRTTLQNGYASFFTSFRGGAIFTSGGTVTVSNSRITSSASTGSGGAVAASGSGATVTISKHYYRQ